MLTRAALKFLTLYSLSHFSSNTLPSSLWYPASSNNLPSSNTSISPPKSHPKRIPEAHHSHSSTPEPKINPSLLVCKVLPILDPSLWISCFVLFHLVSNTLSCLPSKMISWRHAWSLLIWPLKYFPFFGFLLRRRCLTKKKKKKKKKKKITWDM